MVPNWGQDETFGYIGHNSITLSTHFAFTDTYIVSLSYLYSFMMESPIAVQVFTLPPDGSSGKNSKRVLYLTHEGVVENLYPLYVEFLKPLVDPVTGTTRLRLLDCISRVHDFQVRRVDLTLPDPRPDVVSPMTVETRHYTLTKEGEPTRHNCFPYVDVSEEGHVRGFYRKRPPFLGGDATDYMKFTIDTRQDEWVINSGELSHAIWSHLWDTPRGRNESIMFDGMRGKMAFRNQRNIFVVDIE